MWRWQRGKCQRQAILVLHELGKLQPVAAARVIGVTGDHLPAQVCGLESSRGSGCNGCNKTRRRRRRRRRKRRRRRRVRTRVGEAKEEEIRGEVQQEGFLIMRCPWGWGQIKYSGEATSSWDGAAGVMGSRMRRGAGLAFAQQDMPESSPNSMALPLSRPSRLTQSHQVRARVHCIYTVLQLAHPWPVFSYTLPRLATPVNPCAERCTRFPNWFILCSCIGSTYRHPKDFPATVAWPLVRLQPFSRPESTAWRPRS